MTPELRLSWLHVRRLVVKELRQLVRDPTTKRVIFASPIIQLILFGYAVNTDVRHVPMAVVDHDRSVASRLDEGRAGVALEIPVRCGEDLVAALPRGAGIEALWAQFSVLFAMAAGGMTIATRRFRASL